MYSSAEECEPVAVSFEYGNEKSDFRKCWEFREWLSNCQLCCVRLEVSAWIACITWRPSINFDAIHGRIVDRHWLRRTLISIGDDGEMWHIITGFRPIAFCYLSLVFLFSRMIISTSKRYQSLGQLVQRPNVRLMRSSGL